MIAEVTLGYWDGEYPGTYIEEFTLLHHKTKKPHGQWIYEKIPSEAYFKQSLLSRATGPEHGTVHPVRQANP